MGKVAPDIMIDAAFNYIAGSCNLCVVCAGSPSSYATAMGANALAMSAMTSGCFTIADDTSGRKLTMTAKTSASITVSGSALAVALVDTTKTNLLYVTTCTEQYLVSGGTVDIPSWKINIQDPT